MARVNVNRPLRSIERKKRSGCRSVRTMQKKIKLARKRKIKWKKLILPKMDDDDDRPIKSHPKKGKKPQRELTGKQQRKLRKKTKRLAKDREDAMEAQAIKKQEESPEDAEDKEDGEKDVEMKEDE